MKTLGPSVWAVSDGRAGNASQVRALVHALGEPGRWMRIAHIMGEAHRAEPLILTPRAPWTWLSADKWPAPLKSLPTAQRALLAPPWPTLWIAAGRRVGVLAADGDVIDSPSVQVARLGSLDDLDGIAAALFARLRELDASGVDIILACDFGTQGVALAIRDRLTRAADGRVINVT